MTESLQASSGEVAQVPLGKLWHGVERLKARRTLRVARRAADVELLRRASPSLRLAWRVEELVGPKSRLDLAHALRSLVRGAAPRYLPSASPVNRIAVRAESETLLALATRLGDLEKPVSARGVLFVERLLLDGSGPLFDRERVNELPAHLESALTALESR